MEWLAEAPLTIVFPRRHAGGALNVVLWM